MNITINGNTTQTKSTSLKEVLLHNNYHFPCGGIGKCGRCKITAFDLEISDLDRRFLSTEEINSGVRLACDKVLSKDISISYQEQKTSQVKARKLEEGSICIEFGVDKIYLSIVEDELVELLTLDYPWSSKNFGEFLEYYENNKIECSKKLRALICHESIELFEKFSVAKAETMVFAGSERSFKMILGLSIDSLVDDYLPLFENLGLPTATITVLPVINNFVGGDLLAELVQLADDSLFIQCDDVVNLVSITKECDYVASMWDIFNDEMSALTLLASVKTFAEMQENNFVITVMGKYKNLVKEVLENNGYSVVIKENKGYLADNCLNHRFRAKLNKQAKRIKIIDLLTNERFLDNLSSQN